MRLTPMIGAAIAASLVATAAGADRLHAAEGRTLVFGPMHASVYYIQAGTAERVVATIVAGPESTPVRFIATLEPGQSLELSVPGAIGTPPIGLRLTSGSGVLGVVPLGAPID